MLLLAHVNYDFIRHEYINVYATSLNNSNKHTGNAVVFCVFSWALEYCGRPTQRAQVPS